MQGVLPSPGVKQLVSENFVGLASDVDAPEPELVQLAIDNLPGATMLPFVLVLDADGTFLSGSHGAVHPARFKEALEELVAEHRRGGGSA